jgi:NitT/TauT family transport system ATP-binding protein
MPVMPTIAPMPKPKITIAGSIAKKHSRRKKGLIDFPDLLGQERGVRQDTKMPADTEEFAAEVESPASAAPGLRLAGVRHSYGELETIAGIDLEGGAREVLGLVGPSGCGKSTLLELVCGLREPDAGRITVGHAGGGRLAACAFMPQRDLLFPWLSALDNAALAPRNRGLRRGAARDLAGERFARFGLGGFEKARPAELSGGMRQRVAFLRTLLSEKPVLALDEPFAALDAITRAEMQEWLVAALAAEPRTVVLVTHDVEEALYLCDRVAVLSARPARVVEELSAPAGLTRAADRDAAVTDAGFVAARERALRALHRGGR